MRIVRSARAAVAAAAIAVTVTTATAAADDIVPRRDGSKAVDVPAAAPAETRADTADGFQFDDAGVGAAATLALLAASAGVVSLRAASRTPREGAS